MTLALGWSAGFRAVDALGAERVSGLQPLAWRGLTPPNLAPLFSTSNENVYHLLRRLGRTRCFGAALNVWPTIKTGRRAASDRSNFWRVADRSSIRAGPCGSFC